MPSQSEELRNRTQSFAVRILRLFRSLPSRADAQVIGKQLVRSGTSVAANYRACCRARSHDEFAARMGVVVEEADESQLWLELLVESGIMKPQKLTQLQDEAKQLTAIFTASYETSHVKKSITRLPDSAVTRSKAASR
jgi:four helix bundle protein